MSDYHQVIEIYSYRIIKVVTPVLITLLSCAFLTRFLEQVHGNLHVRNSFDSTLGMQNQGATVGESILVAVIVIIGIVLTTALLLFLYFKGYVKIIYAWMLFSVAIMFSVYVEVGISKISLIDNIPVDYISFIIFIINLVVVGIMAVFWRGPPIVTQFFLILMSVIVALVFLQLPDWTIWTLMILLIFYDYIVVLCPNGLLKMLIEKSEERGDSLPALIYTTAAYEELQEEEDKDDIESREEPKDEDLLLPLSDFSGNNSITIAPDDPKPQKRKHRKKHSESIQLGLGDFVFYGTLITRASRFGWDLVILCSFAIILGLSLTLLCLSWLQKPLPALPFSLAFGMIFFIVGILVFRGFNSIFRTSLFVF